MGNSHTRTATPRQKTNHKQIPRMESSKIASQKRTREACTGESIFYYIENYVLT